VIISSALQFSCGTEKTMELLCDVIILLCELIKSQDTKTDEVARMLNALKYCLQNLGVTIKVVFLKKKKQNSLSDIFLGNSTT
jgi:hypothetical protein